jgi:hypothetical protein
LAGGACVLGGAAMLGWIGFDHLMHRGTATHVDFAGKVSDERDSQSTKFQPPAVVSASAAVAGSTPALSSATPRPASASIPKAASVSIPASISSPASRLAPARVIAERPASQRRKLVRDKSGAQPGQIYPRGASRAVANQPSHRVAIADDVARGAIPKVAANVSPKPSAAGSYSPLAPARLGVDEYAGVTMSAATHVRDLAPLPRTGSPNNASGTSGTEWMNHLSQRRVTDVPDQFAK